MSNPFRNIAAGALDLAGTPLDLVGLGAGAISGTASFLTGNGFWNGYADNPFTQFANDYHKGVTELTGADDESLVREVVGAADVLVGGGIAKGVTKRMAKKKLAKRLAGKTDDVSKKIVARIDKEKDTWVKDMLKESVSLDSLGKNLGDYAVANAALGLVTPGEGENDSFWRAAGAATLGRRGLKKLKRFKTKTDLSEMTPQEKYSFKVNRFLDRDLADNRRISWVDAQGGAVDKWLHSGVIDEAMSVELKKTATDRAFAMPQMDMLGEIVNDAKKMSKESFDKMNKMYGINYALGSRVGGLRNWLETVFDKSVDGLDADKMQAAMKAVESLGFKSEKEVNAFLKKLDSHNDILDMVEMCLPILEKMPNAGVKGLEGIDTKKLIADFKVLRKELGQRHFMNTKMKTLDKQILDMYLESGMIGSKTYERLLKDVQRGLYVPSKSDAERSLKEIYKSANPMESHRRDIADVTLENMFRGVDDTGNGMNIFAGKIKSELEAYQRNLVIRDNLPALEIGVNKKAQSLDKAVKTLRGYDKETAERMAEYQKTFSEVKMDAFTSDDVIKRSRERQITPEMALDDLEKKYAEKGLYRLESYKKVPVKKYGTVVGSRSVKTYSYVPKSFQYIFEQRAVNASTMNKIIVKTNRLFTGTISGKWNPFFLAKRMWYGINEMVPALRTELAQQGINVGTWDIMKMYWSSLEDSFRHNYAKMMLDALDDDVFLGKMARGNKEYYRKQLDDILGRVQELNMSRNDVVGDVMRNSANAVDISFNKTTQNEMMQMATKAWQWVDESSLGRVLELMKNSVDDASQRTILKMIDKHDLAHKPIFNRNGKMIAQEGLDKKVVNDIVKKMSDTRRRGAGDTMLGMFFNAIQDYMPYGASSLQGLVGKFEYLPKDLTTNAKNYLQRAYKANNQSFMDTGLDALAKLGTKMAELPDNMVFDTLWKTIAIPATLCYVWNYGNDDNARYYNSLKPYERSNKFQLVNFFGPGLNLTIPLDQEWSILKNVYDAMLERSFGLSQAHDSGNPAFSMKEQLLWSLGQDFGLALPVAAESAINLAGYKTNLDLSTAIKGEAPIEQIDSHRFHTLDDGLATAMMQMTGKLGKILVNFAEDRPVMDYRYAVPFLQIQPKQKITSDTVSWLNQQLKLNPTPELQKWARQRQYIMADMKFYERNGCTKAGKVLGSRKEVLKSYQKQLDDITKRVYYKTQDRYAQAPVLTGQALSGDVDMNQMSLQEDSPLANQ